MRLWRQNPHRNVPIRITGERLLFTQADMHYTNFGVDEQGKTVLLDFGAIAFLPESFARFAFSSKEFDPIIKSLGLSGSNMAAMCEIAGVLGMTSDPKLGASAYAWH
jgi:ABC1 atypical kinase-like domain